MNAVPFCAGSRGIPPFQRRHLVGLVPAEEVGVGEVNTDQPKLNMLEYLGNRFESPRTHAS
eukprot:4378713-Pyramimonas_sp.AAC.1